MNEITAETIVGVEDWLEEYIYGETGIRFCQCSIMSWRDTNEYIMWVEVSYDSKYGKGWEGNLKLRRWVGGICRGYKLFVAVNVKVDKLWEWITMKKLVG